MVEEPLLLHPELSSVYQRKVANLTASLNEEGSRTEAAEIILSLISEIRLVPEGETLSIELVGALAGIVALSQTANARSNATGNSVSLIAGRRNQRCRLEIKSLL